MLVEREPSIGGHMAQLSETFPTLDCSQCIMTPKMVDVANHPNITLHTYSEIEKVDGYIGNFQVTIRKKARSVDMDKCTGCGVCMAKCPQKKIPNSFDRDLGHAAGHLRPLPPGRAQHPGHRPGELHLVQDRQVRRLPEGVRPRGRRLHPGRPARHRSRSAPSSSPPASSSTPSPKSRKAPPSRATASSATARSPTSSTA